MIDETKLIEASRRGDTAAFSELVRRYENTVFGFAFKVCRNREKAEETLQDTFVNVYRKLDQFDGKSKFTTWLYRIVTNNCFMINRQRKIDEHSISLDQSGFLRDELEHHDPTPIEKMVSGELNDKLDKTILKLPVDYRLVFVLRDVEGLSTEETGKILDISPSAVKSRLHRARAFLRDHLKDYVSS